MAVADKAMVEAVYHERGRILRQKAEYQQKIDDLDPTQAGNWPLLIRAAWGVGLTDEELCYRLCMNEEALYSLASGTPLFLEEDVLLDMGDILGDMAHVHMNVLYEALNIFREDYVPA